MTSHNASLPTRRARIAFGTLAAFAAALPLACAISDRARAAAADSISQTVSVSDLDLASAQGQAQALTRIKVAANHICDETAGIGHLIDFAKCVDDVTDSAMPQLSLRVATARVAALSHGTEIATAR